MGKRGARAYEFTFWGEENQILVISLQWFGDLFVLPKKRRKKKGERKAQKVQVRATVERGGEAIFRLYLFLKRKEEGKLDECSQRLRYRYLFKFGYGFTHLLVRNPPNFLFDCVWIGKTIIQYIYVELEFK